MKTNSSVTLYPSPSAPMEIYSKTVELDWTSHGYIDFGISTAGKHISGTLSPGNARKLADALRDAADATEAPRDIPASDLQPGQRFKFAPNNVISRVSAEGMTHLCISIPRRTHADNYFGTLGWVRDGDVVKHNRVFGFDTLDRVVVVED